MLKRLLLTLILTATSLPLFASAATHYALIIDAGSTGSRLYLFEYNTESIIPSIEARFSAHVTPGLASFKDHPAQAGEALAPALTATLRFLKQAQIDPKTVPLSVLGTAGMRLLKAPEQKALYQALATYIQTHSELPLAKLETISGKFEGLYGWLDLNYLLNSFEGTQDHTRGSIDVGGASTQLSFSTTEALHPEDLSHLKIGNQDYQVYSKSFLGLGLVETSKQISKEPLASTCYPEHYPLNETQKGHYQFASCSNLYLQLLDHYHLKQQLPSLANKHFIAFSGAYYTEHFFGLDQTPDKKHTIEKLQTLCTQSWETLRTTFPQEPESRLALYCANETYLNDLFFETYQLQDQSIEVKNEINHNELNWARGALFYELISAHD